MKEERLFEYLRRKESGEAFSEDVVNNWYIARKYVLDQFREKKFAFWPGCSHHLHVTIVGDSPLMLAVLRQVALSAHFINFVEYDGFGRLVCRNRTLISLVSNTDAGQIVAELEKEENLCNLLKYCEYSVYGNTYNKDSYLDIRLEIVSEEPEQSDLLITEENVQDYVKTKNGEELFSIDTRNAVYASRAYALGNTINNVPYEGIFSVKRYNRAVNKFQFRLLEENNREADMKLVHDDWNGSLSAVKEGLSNLFCSDCFFTRKKEIEKTKDVIEKRTQKKTSFSEVWESTNQALSLSEHIRWVVEKLIMGYRPLNDQEWFQYESCFGNQRKSYAKALKSRSSDPAHIDLCSYRDVRRIDPDNLKYDSFLMLAIPMILDKSGV